MTFLDLFRAATGGKTPYLWQCRLACGEPPPEANCDLHNPDEATLNWLSQGTSCSSRLIDIPTGLGKTIGVVMAWLWNSLRSQTVTLDTPWPRRLVYCLPMRTLVEQTVSETESWIRELRAAALSGKFRLSEPALQNLLWLCGTVDLSESQISNLPFKIHHRDAASPVILMGGEDLSEAKRDWDLYPEKPCILIGTQDMLLSRALNRGYGMSRYRWPMHFALLNNDALWVMDEVQLMGAGLWTSAQLDWMRQLRFQTQFPTMTWWMSATLGGSFLATSDRNREKMIPPDPVFRLLPEEEQNLPILKARRPIEQLTVTNPPKKPAKQRSKTAKADGGTTPYDALASHIVEHHAVGTLSLVVCNRVAHAQETFKALKAIKSELSEQAETSSVELLTSRFRPDDRSQKLASILAFERARKAGQPHKGLILVSTQVVEAGFDVSATRLWTQLAPWPSLVQRLGRLNRDGNSNDSARAFVFDFPRPAKDKSAALPYDEADLKVAESIVKEVTKLCEANSEKPIRQILEALKSGLVAKDVEESFEPIPQPYPRALDIHGLFSTEPDLFGGFTDVSPWVRNSDQNADVTVFWRDFKDTTKDANAGNGPGFRRDEGCPVAVYRLKDDLSKSSHAYHWNDSTDQWESISPDAIRPGMTLLLPASAGGYNQAFGWTGNKSDKLSDLPPPGPFAPGSTHDPESETGEWITLAQHLDDTKHVAQEIAARLHLSQYLRDALIEAAALHDIGKSLISWQRKLLEVHEVTETERANELWAKSPVRYVPSEDGKTKRVPFRPGLRHEVASALAMWHRFYRAESAAFPALAIYLVAAHHGKARTVLAARASTGFPNVEGIPIPSRDEQGHRFAPLPWGNDWQMDFSAAEDGASGHFSDDGTSYTFDAPGWTGLVADLLGGWEKDAPTHTCSAVPDHDAAAFGPFALAYLEALLRAADGRASQEPSIKNETSKSLPQNHCLA